MASGVVGPVGPVGWCPVVALVVHSWWSWWPPGVPWWPTPNPRVETLGYYWEGVVKRFALVLESGLKSTAMGHLCPIACGPVKED